MNLFTPSKIIRYYHSLQQIDYGNVEPQIVEGVKVKMLNLNSHKPKVSVVLIAHNEEKNLFGCLASLSHTVVDFPIEIIVVNNASSDKTGQIIADAGLREIVEQKKGFGFARQRGLEEARGEVVITGDADTIYGPHWVSEMAAPFEQSGTACVYSLHALLSENGKYGPGLITYQFLKLGSWMLKHRKRPHLNCGGASMAFRKKDAMAVGGYKLDNQRWEDGMLAYKLGELGEVRMVNSKRAIIYTSMRNVSNDGTLFRAFMKRLGYRIRHLDSFLFTQTD